MNFSDDLQISWITPMRTASRTCIQIQKFFNFNRLGCHDVINYKDKKNYQLLMNVRSPYPRIVSIFVLNSFHQNNFNIEFSKWLNTVIDKKHKEINFYTLYLDQIINKLEKVPDDYIRVEFLENDLLKLKFIQDKILNLKNIFDEFIRKNTFDNEFSIEMGHNRKSWQSFYNQELADMVYDNMKAQFDMFNYNKNYWKDGTP